MDGYSQFQPVRFLTRFLYTAHALHAFKLFSAQEFLMILENTLKSEFLYNSRVQLEMHRQPMEISVHEVLNQHHEIYYIRTVPISASLGVLI